MATATVEISMEDIESRLSALPSEASIAIAARAALRVVVFHYRPGAESKEKLSEVVLVTLRAAALPWAVSTFSLKDVEVLEAAKHATSPAGHLRLVSSLSQADTVTIDAVSRAAQFASATTIAENPIGDASNAVSAANTAAKQSETTSFATATAFMDDIQQVEEGLPAENLAALPLWPRGEMIDDVMKSWEGLKSLLFSINEDWKVWTEWYEARLFGRSPAEEVLEVARITLPNVMWQQGPKLVNAEIRLLTEFHEKGGPEMVMARLAELREQYPETEVLSAEADQNDQDISQTFAEVPEGSVSSGNRQTPDEATANSDDETPPGQTQDNAVSLPSVWILQFNPEDWQDAPQIIERGEELPWKTKKALPEDQNFGDPVVYWRTRRQGGLVGTGHIGSGSIEQDSDGTNRFPTEVHEFNQDNLIPRKTIIEAAGITRRSWQGAVLDLPREQALKLDAFLRREGRAPVFTDEQLAGAGIQFDTRTGGSSTNTGDGTKSSTTDDQSQTGTGTGDGSIDTDTSFSPDDAETEQDDLGRGILAIALARRLHLIWCRLNNAMWQDPDKKTKSTRNGQSSEETTDDGNVFFDRSRKNTRAGFVLHLDAPWGGGKTTFANFLARVLNPTGYTHGKNSFLKKRYGDADLSTVFLRDPPPKDGSGTGDGRDWPDEARRPWIVVPFNAWQAQHVTPPWWVFYQTIRKRCFESVVHEGWAPGKTNGKSAKTPGWWKRQYLWLRLWVPEIWWRLWNPKVKTLLFTALVSGGLLGLLAWAGVIDVLGTPGKEKVGFVLTDGIGILLGGLTGLSFLWGIGALLTESIRPGTKTLAERLSLGDGDPFERFRKHFYKTIERVRRPVLVIVDDLDRCSPEFIVDLVRGTQTLLRSPRVVFVILGDRDWIERAFEVHHKDMNKVSVGPEQTFGARFVEKAIQMSFILPGLARERQKEYVRRQLLGSKADKQQDGAKTISPETSQYLRVFFQQAVQQPSAAVFNSEILKTAVRNAADEEQEKQAKPDVAEVLSDETAFGDWFKDEYTIHAATDEAVEKEISHRLEPLADNLPANPRQIKRIINGVTMYNAVARHQRDTWKQNNSRWMQLARWIVIMTEWPKTWRLLVSYPAIADLLFAQDPEDAFQQMKQDPLRAAELPDSQKASLEEIARIKGDLKLMALISGDEDKEGEKLDHTVISDLASLTPLHSRIVELSDNGNEE
ncbi:putative P-loop ATPase [Roseibium album]|nr:putative P-loop ATPase [Roseibium album]